MAHIPINAQSLIAEIAALKHAFPELEDDADLLATTLEGETNLHDVLAACVDREREAKAMAGAVKERISDLSARKARYERQQDAWRDLIQKLMDHAGQAKITLPEATLSISHRKPSPIIVNEALLPEECCDLVRVPNKATIKVWCGNDNIPDGVTMSNGSSSVTIRVR